MSEFPRLKTGAVAQYPAEKTIACSTQVLRFVDGSEQRCREYSAPLRKWIIGLDLLDERELAELEGFFIAQQGAFGDFVFVDPWDGTEYAHCSLGHPEVALQYVAPGDGKCRLTVYE